MPDAGKVRVLRGYLRGWKAEAGVFFDGAGPDSAGDQIRGVAPSHPVSRLDTELLQRGRPVIAAVEELLVGKPEVAVHDGFPSAVQPTGATGELKGRQRCFHSPASCQPNAGGHRPSRPAGQQRQSRLARLP